MLSNTKLIPKQHTDSDRQEAWQSHRQAVRARYEAEVQAVRDAQLKAQLLNLPGVEASLLN